MNQKGGLNVLAGFWSGETLTDRLETLVTPFDPDRVYCSAYTLSMSRERYVSPNEAMQDPLTTKEGRPYPYR